jgi:hypothetical protein
MGQLRPISVLAFAVESPNVILSNGEGKQAHDAYADAEYISRYFAE